MATTADVNIRDEFISPVLELTNKHAISGFITKQPASQITTHDTNGLSNKLVFDFNTGDFYTDVYKSNFMGKYLSGTNVNYATIDGGALINMFASGKFFQDSKSISMSNNWTQDYMTSERTTHGPAYLKAVHNMNYADASATNAWAAGAEYRMDCMYLSGFFLRTKDLIIPPNTQIRIELVIDADWVHGGLLKNNADGADITGISGLELWMNLHQIRLPKVAETQIVKYITLDSFSFPSANGNKQYSCKDNLVKIAVANQSSAIYTVPANETAKKMCKTRFTYETNESTTVMKTLTIKAGNQDLYTFDHGDATLLYGHLDTYNHFLNNSEKSLYESDYETLTQFMTQGPIYMVPVIHSEIDKINSISLATQFAAAPASNTFIFCFNEQMVKYNYSNGIKAGVETLI